MKSHWDENEAQQYIHDPLQLRIYTSRLLGGDPSLVLHGGGNTSVKATSQNLFGDSEEILYVKGSGWDLATIEAPGFAPVKLAVLKRMAELAELSDVEMVKNQRAAMLDPAAPNPSVEAILHAIIPFTYVDHTHADAVVTITNTPSGAERIRQLYGPNMLIVPYVMPGFILAKTIYEMTRDIDWTQLDGMVLLNHGIFTFAHNAKQSYERMIEIVSQAEEDLARQCTSFVMATATHKALSQTDLLTIVQIRKAISNASGSAMLAHLNQSEPAVGFATLPNVSDLATRGLLTPDHVIRTRRIPVILEETGNNEQISEDSELPYPYQAIHKYAEAYRTYFERNAASASQDELAMLDPAPRWAVWRGRGTLAFGRNRKEIQIIDDIQRHTIRAIQWAEALDRWQVLGEKEIFEIEYWELEQAKLRKGDNPPTLQGKVALISGAASGIGCACAEAFHAQGAAVVALDIHPDITIQFPQSDILGLICDITNEEAVQSAIAAVICEFGGIDILVSNAGIFPPSTRLADMDAANWQKSLELNLSSHQRLLQSCIPYLELGIDPAVIIIASKNVPAPGPGAGAYSVAKAGLTQLARVAALELAASGIRVNVLHPNAVFDTGLWTPEILASRAKSYNMNVEEYKTNNLLRVEVTSKDVAAMACAMAGPLFAKTTGAQVPIDGGNERVV